MGTVSNTHINSRVQELMSLIRSRPNYLNEKEAIGTLAKTVKCGNKLLRDSSDESNKSDAANNCLIFEYAQFLLDFSYAIELKLVAEEFEEKLVHHVDTVFGYLDEILSLLTPLKESSDQTVKFKVKELLECTYWRKGALLYMLCHTFYHQPSRYLTDISSRTSFALHCRDGVVFLTQEMRRVREEDVQTEYATNDDHLLMLIKEGIFSDTNMLAIMYSAEMCTWLYSYLETYNIQLDMNFDARLLAEQLAKQYIRIAEGPLKEANWNTSHALTIVQNCRNST